MYEIAVSSETPISKVQKCLKQLEPKVMWCDFDLERRILLVDDADSNPDDIKGTILSMLGIDNIDEFKETV